MSLKDQWNFIEREALLLGATKYAVQKWRRRRTVPHKYRIALLTRAVSMGFVLRPESFDACQDGGDL